MTTVRRSLWSLCLCGAILLSGCQTPRDLSTVVFLIESHPTSLDPRVGTDAQSERMGQLIFDALVDRDASFQLRPSLAETWEIRDPLTYVFHLRRGVHFHDGRVLTARDVRYTFTSMLEGTVTSAKTATYRPIDRIETPDDATVIFHLKQPFASFLWNVAQGAIGIVPEGSGKDFGAKPVGTGAFRFVRASQDEDVILERNPDYWRGSPPIARVQFKVTPDATVRALELQKGAADITINSLTADMVRTLAAQPHLRVVDEPGTVYQYVALNMEDPLLQRVEVRQALAYAMDRRPLIDYLWRGQARMAGSLLPPNHWASSPDAKQYPHDPQRARELLDAAGFRAGADGVRLRLTMKTSTEETSRLLATVLQQQFREVGIQLDLRSNEFATFYADIVKGAFQLYTLRWIGGNNDPDIFENCFHSSRIPPKGANRGHYNKPELDRLLDAASVEMDQEKRRALLLRVQVILNEDLPYLHLWFFDNVVVHHRRLEGLQVFPSGDYDFLKTLRTGPTGS